jgi:beta-1,4-mannosyl-glycoprotein beta-1,4-N-acetylglucosaminyltransferase
MIIDAFTFFNEKELVELRIKYLSDIVDCFLIVEADVTHTGKKKEWNFPELLNNSLKQYSSKIHYNQMKVDLEKAETEQDPRYKSLKGSLSNTGRSWKVDNMQRNFIKEAYKKSLTSDDDIIIISDLDEIPSKDKISFIKSCDFKKIAPVAFAHSLFHLSCEYLDLEEWIGSVVITKELIEKYEPQIFRDYKNRISHISNAGWSFSSFGGEKRIKEKLEAFGHVELNKEEYKNAEHFKRCVETGEDLFNRKVNKKRVNKNFFPNDLLKLMEENLNFYFYSNTSN